MPLLREKDRSALRELGKNFTADVDVTLFTQRTSPLDVPGVVPCETCEHAEELAGEVSELMPRVHVDVVDFVENRDRATQQNVDRLPTMVLGGKAENRVRFIGFPAGYEAATLMKALMDAGGAPDAVPQEIAQKLAGVTKPVDLKVFVTPT